MKLILATSAFVVLAAGCSTSNGAATSPAVSATGVTQPARAASSAEPAATEPAAGGLLGEVEQPVSSPPGTDGDHDATATPSTTTPTGIQPNDVAVRVALTSFNDPDWAVIVAGDLDPSYAALIEAQRRGDTDPPPHRTLQLVAVESHSEQPNTALVSFDEITDVQAIRHVTAITFEDVNASRPLVVDVSPIA